MKPIKATTNDTDALIELGRASVQVVHDLKNQINGLKLYATFLRKRMERGERPADELETINKIMAGLERAATDMNLLVRLGRPLEIQRSASFDLAALLAEATEGDFAGGAPAPASSAAVTGAAGGGAYRGHFDAPALTEALKNIHAGARSLAARDAVPSINLRREETEATGATGAAATPNAVIEWHGVKAAGDNDVFSSFSGGTGLRLALAARIIQAHDGTVEQAPDALRVRLPLKGSDE
jgi:nitrogen fixation/metabolism regulation signal transduction histidine kinase